MATTHFKLTKPGGLTRRVTFPEQPTWATLATKIETLFLIPIGQIAVSYVDIDGDEVTLSSHDELAEYYSHSYKRGESIKFGVVDLSTLRSNRTHERGTFGDVSRSVILIDESEWNRIPPLFGDSPVDISSHSRHAFVEPADSESEGGGTVVPPRKGKARDDDDNASTASVMDGDDDGKYDIHVYDHAEREASATSAESIRSTPTVTSNDLTADDTFDHIRGQATDTADTSTAKPLPKTPSSRPLSVGPHSAPGPSLAPNTALPNNATSNGGQPERRNSRTQAPPRPAPQDHPPGNARERPVSIASLTNDVANLLDLLVATISAHPELAEGIRNLARNARNGVYWANERDRFHQAVDQLFFETRTPRRDGSRSSGDEAGRRVAEAIGNVFRSIITATDTNTTPSQHRRSLSNQPHVHSSRPVVPPPPPPPMMSQWIPPPPILGPQFAPNFGTPPAFGVAPSPSVYPRVVPEVPPIPPPPPSLVSPGLPPHQRTRPWWMEQLSNSQSPGHLNRGNNWTGPTRPSPASNPFDTSGATANDVSFGTDATGRRIGPHERKLHLEAAKAHYKSEKEMFRREKEERRREKKEANERRAEEGIVSRLAPEGEMVVARIPLFSVRDSTDSSTIGRGTPAPSSVLTPSNRRTTPFAEVYSVPSHQPLPTRNPDIGNVSSSPGPRTPKKSVQGERVLAQLSNMGLTPVQHPTLPTLLQKQLLKTPSATDEKIVQNLCESLLSGGRRTPQASGSNVRA